MKELLEEAQEILEGVLQYCKPIKVLQYGEKYVSCTQKLKSVNICIILSEEDKQGLLCKLYLSIDATIPFQLLLYTSAEWEDLTQDAASYASMIAGRGTVIYEKNA